MQAEQHVHSSEASIQHAEFPDDRCVRLWTIRVAETGDGKSETRWFLIAQINLALIVAIIVGLGFAVEDLSAGPDQAAASGVGGVIGILIFVAVALFVIRWFSRRDLRYVSNGLLNQHLVELAPRAPDFNDDIEKLRVQMELPTRMRLLIDRRDASCSAAAIDIGESTVVVVSLGLLALYRKDRDATLAIVAHELSHLVQGDSRNWRFPYAVFRFFAVLLLLNLVVGLFDAAIKSTSLSTFAVLAGTAAASVILPGLLQLPWFLKMRAFRWRSEETADLAALAFVGMPANRTSACRLSENWPAVFI